MRLRTPRAKRWLMSTALAGSPRPGLLRWANEKHTGKILISMSFPVMAGLVQAIHVVGLVEAQGLPIGRQQRGEGRCGGPTWMAGTSLDKPGHDGLEPTSGATSR
jgi:hypothetical protein